MKFKSLLFLLNCLMIFTLPSCAKSPDDERIDQASGHQTVRWEVDGKVLPPACFQHPSLSGDGWEEVVEIYEIQEVAKFFNDPGFFMGDPITKMTDISLGSCTGDQCSKISLLGELRQCNDDSDVEILDSEVRTLSYFSDGSPHRSMYKNLGEIDQATCSAMAPNLGVTCEEGYVITVGYLVGGSLGWYTVHGAYGLFDIPSYGRSIVPLKFFLTRNEAMDFITDR